MQSMCLVLFPGSENARPIDLLSRGRDSLLMCVVCCCLVGGGFDAVKNDEELLLFCLTGKGLFHDKASALRVVVAGGYENLAPRIEV